MFPARLSRTIPQTAARLLRAQPLSSFTRQPSRLRITRWQNDASFRARPFSGTTRRSKDTFPSSSAAETAPDIASSELKFKAAEPRLSLTFTCTVVDCGTRSSHEFTKRSYERGIVLVECPGCKNRHLIADHLGWFKESTQDGQLKTVEDLMRAKGEKVRRGRVDEGGTIEYAPE